jgi:hypothetical protein
MRPSSSLGAVATLAAALVLGCGERPGPAEPVVAPPALAAHQGLAPASVSHNEQGAFLFVDPDPAPGLTVLIGWTLDEIELFCATGEITIGSLRELLVIRPDGTLHLAIQGARIPLLVWESDSGDLCALLEQPHLTGTGQLSVTDNDLFVGGNRTNAAHVGIHGQVASETGERYHLLGNWHGRILKGSAEQDDRSDFRLVAPGR